MPFLIDIVLLPTHVPVSSREGGAEGEGGCEWGGEDVGCKLGERAQAEHETMRGRDYCMSEGEIEKERENIGYRVGERARKRRKSKGG